VRSRDLDAVLARFLAVPEPPAAPAISGDALDEIRGAMGRNFPIIVQRYLDDADASLAALRDAVRDGNEREIEHIAHRLKGSSGIVAATTLARLCQRFVDDPRQPASTLGLIEDELARVRTQLHASLERA
jgi:HPt (histidine-containing phosphotransfer) domain-containing protein